jgi:uncharacterized iron-regulated membrane protein
MSKVQRDPFAEWARRHNIPVWWVSLSILFCFFAFMTSAIVLAENAGPVKWTVVAAGHEARANLKPCKD